ncbi:MAG TPA: isopeptide-forming domain-containing fimbrial protein, partial [Thermoanaerobaculia bacterium]|nr:isopeptide-forming domain-containing fimbrial protein [Thermoanaerobaculia bacterium]
MLGARPALAQPSCATPGKDGPGGTLAGVVNTYYPALPGIVAAGSTSIPLGAAVGASQPISSGDLVLVIQMQDAAIDSTNTGSYGDGIAGDPARGSTSLNSAGFYEYAAATGAVPLSGGSLALQGAGAGGGLLNTYTSADATATQGQRRFQVVRVPQYTTATLGSSLTALNWSGTAGGVLAIDVSGALDLGSATVSLLGLGFRGGGGLQLTGGAGGSNTDYRTLSTSPFNGAKGEGIAGTPAWILDPTTNTVVNTGGEGYPNGSMARGAPGNAGGGGTDGNPSANDQNSGGGGGGNGGIGGQGGNTWNSNLTVGGFGGDQFPASAAQVILGGGGGAGTRNNSTGVAASGGAGGGIALFRAQSVSGAGPIIVDG